MMLQLLLPHILLSIVNDVAVVVAAANDNDAGCVAVAAAVATDVVCRQFIPANTRRSPNVGTMLAQCWPIVYDADPTLYQHWVNVTCLLGML